MSAMQRKKRLVLRRQSGVTLMELLTVVTIIGILAAISIPSYRNYIVRANRSDAKTALLWVSGALERCYTRNNTYDPDAVAGCNVDLPKTSDNGHYQVTAAPGGNPVDYRNGFILTATPQGEQATADADCGNLTLTSTNERDRSGTKDKDECWGK
jgi:type IV pilus assembly protein PilE